MCTTPPNRTSLHLTSRPSAPLVTTWSDVAMSRAIPCPPPKPLAKEENGDCQRDKEDGESGIEHDGLDVPDVRDPGVEELGHAVSPQVLEHCRRDQNLPGDRLVGINL